MELIYSVLDTLLPFSWMEYAFMKNALLAILLMTPLFGLLSTMVVSSRMAFFSDSLGHGAFTGSLFRRLCSPHHLYQASDSGVGGYGHRRVFLNGDCSRPYDYEPRRRVLQVLPAADRRCTEYYTV